MITLARNGLIMELETVIRNGLITGSWFYIELSS